MKSNCVHSRKVGEKKVKFPTRSFFRVCYDRAPKHRLALTFILSALWHGVYPGYYFTFLTAIPITIAARAVSCLHYLQSNALKYKWKVIGLYGHKLTMNRWDSSCYIYNGSFVKIKDISVSSVQLQTKTYLISMKVALKMFLVPVQTKPLWEQL